MIIGPFFSASSLQAFPQKFDCARFSVFRHMRQAFSARLHETRSTLNRYFLYNFGRTSCALRSSTPLRLDGQVSGILEFHKYLHSRLAYCTIIESENRHLSWSWQQGLVVPAASSLICSHKLCRKMGVSDSHRRISVVSGKPIDGASYELCTRFTITNDSRHNFQDWHASRFRLWRPELS